jgi:hypothetical protein
MAKNRTYVMRLTEDEYAALKLAAGKKPLSQYILSRCIARPRPTVPYDLWSQGNKTS